MKIKEIATVTIAGLASLAALVLVEIGDPTPASSLSSSNSAEKTVSFQDNSTVIETSLPAPTAEPPVIVEDDDEVPSEVTAPVAETVAEAESETVAEPITSPVSQLVGAVEEAISTPLPELSELPADVLIEDAESKPAADSESPDATSLAGTPLDEDPEPGVDSDFVDSFAEAVEKATVDIQPEPATATAAVTTTGETGEDGEPASIIEETATGFWLRQAKLNDVFQHLAQLGNHQYFHNADLEGPSFVVTGQLMDDDPIRQMEELALMYGVTIHRKGNTVYALNSAQLSQLPTEPFRYQLKYLRPGDIEQIKLILQPFLTPGSGIIEYETKTNTLIVMDNERKLDALALFLEQIDQPKQQIAIETRILRVSSNAKNQVGVDWGSVLGDQGLSVSAASSLNALFNLPDIETVSRIITGGGAGGSIRIADNTRDYSVSETYTKENNEANLVLSPVQLSVVLRALHAGGLAQQESSPTLITEDNEEGLISIIDRVPIITSTVSETTAGQNISEDVRYTIDPSDPVGDPATTREIGVSVSVTPTILPDDTIRMALRPRSAQVVDFIRGQTGNVYPRVNESTVTTTARVPNGHSLLIGGFYEETTSNSSSKVPILGDIPAVNLLFKNDAVEKQNTSLVFIVTPKLYRPDVPGTERMSHEMHESHILPSGYDSPNPDRPAENYKPRFREKTKNSFRKYEPEPPSNILHPAHPYNLPESSLPESNTSEPDFSHNSYGYQGQGENAPSVTVRSASSRNGGFLGKLFKGNKAKRTR